MAGGVCPEGYVLQGWHGAGRAGGGLGARAELLPGRRSRVQATSQLKSWWGSGNFPPVLDAASDLKMPAQPPRMRSRSRRANAI